MRLADTLHAPTSSGKVNEGAGYVRFMQEDKLPMPASATGQITPQWIFRNFPALLPIRFWGLI